MLAVIGRPELNHRVSAVITAGRDQARRAFSRKNSRGLALTLRLVEGALAILLGVLLALMALRIFSPLPLPKAAMVPVAQQTASLGEPFVVKNPFPVAGDAPIAAGGAPEVADTTLDLTLTGVWAARDGGSATIETPDGKQSRYAVGDEIVDGVTLEAVYTDQVIINRAGVRESLRFESKTSTPAQQPRKTNRNAGNAPARSPSTANRSIGDFLRLAPGTDESGKLVVDIYAARNRNVFYQYGFRDGDRLVSINGAPPPTNPAALSAAIGAMQRQGDAVIVVRRNGREIPVTLSLERVGNL
jgi:general secretion pathway protein C